MSELQRCTKCVMPETWSGISFDEEGICSICRNYEKKSKIDWNKRQGDLQDILIRYIDYAKVYGNKYECIIGYSGGKDTAYTLWAMVKKYKMKCLAVTWDHGFRLSSEGEYNLMEIPKILDVDHLRFTIGNGLRNVLCRRASEIMGDFCWHCHNGIGAFPARISYMMGIPLQIWGEPTAEYGTFGEYIYEDIEEQNKEHFKKVFQTGITPEMIKPEGYDLIDLEPMTWPSVDRSIFSGYEGKKIPFLKAIYLGNYEPWNQRENVAIIKKELEWKERLTENTWCAWDKVDCPYETIRDYQKYIRRGFGKASFQASKDIRDGLITRKEGLKLVEQYEYHSNRYPSNLEDFCYETGIFDLEMITNRAI